MYRERIILHTKDGTGATTLELLKACAAMWDKQKMSKARVLRNVSGQQGTFIFERDYESHDKFFEAHKKMTSSDEFQKWFPNFRDTMDIGEQEYLEIAA